MNLLIGTCLLAQLAAPPASRPDLEGCEAWGFGWVYGGRCGDDYAWVCVQHGAGEPHRCTDSEGNWWSE